MNEMMFPMMMALFCFPIAVGEACRTMGLSFRVAALLSLAWLGLVLTVLMK